MSPARVTLHSLLTEGSVARVPMDATICTQLLRQARNHLRTAARGPQLQTTRVPSNWRMTPAARPAWR